MSGWIYDPVGLNGGAGGEVFRTVFNGSGFEAAELLAREAIQNSVDAARPGERPRITISASLLSGDALNAFWAGAALDELARRADVLELPEGNALEVRPEVLRVLHIADRGTTGLSGDPTDVNAGVKLGHGAAQNWATLGLRETFSAGGGQSAALSM